MKITLRNSIVLALSVLTFSQIDPISLVTRAPTISQAFARVGRPMTPGSVAGVARRTTRRTVRRTTTYVARLPAHCTKVNVNGAVLSHCGGVYYQPYSGRYVVVHVN